MANEGGAPAVRAEQSYPRLISLAVHELRTPASVVGGYLRMLQRDQDPLTERQRKLVDEAARSCARLVELVAELSDLSKIDEGTVSMARRPIDFFPLVQDVAGSVHEADDREVRLDVRGLSAGAIVNGDAGRLAAAVGAIIKAILREQPSGLTVVADRRLVNDDGVRAAALVVAPEERVQTAYDSPPGPFDEKRGGLGLALPIARRVIDAHGGRLWSPAADNQETTGRNAAIVVLPLELSR